MARSVFSHLIFSLVALIFLISARVHAQDVPCDKIRTCSTLLQKYELAALTCRAELKSYKCNELDRNSDLGKYARDCTPESMCYEAKFRQIAKSAIRGCTQGARDFGSSVWGGLQVCHELGPVKCPFVYFTQALPQTVFNIGKGLVWDPAVSIYQMVTGTTPTPTQTAKLAQRAFYCLNYEGNFKLGCESAGMVFAEATFLRSVAAGLRGVGAIARAEVRAVEVRTARVAERARVSTGAPARRPPVIAETRRQANMSAPVRRVDRFAESTRPENIVAGLALSRREKEPPAVRTIADTQRDQYIERLIGRQNTTVEQRRAFAELAFRAEPKGNTIFLDIQNSKMKYMNDHLKDKNLVTAITNARLKAMFDELRAKYPNLQAEKFEYDDFKSGRFGFKFTDGKVPSGFMDDLRRTMNEAEEKFVAELGEYDLVPKGSDLLPPEKWFASGTGFTPDEANLACRYAARCQATTVNFRDSRVLKTLGARLTQTETVRRGAMKALRNTNLTETLPNGQVIPTIPVYEAFRKATSAKDFARRIKESTRQSITTQTASSMMNYLKSLDEWSTGLLLVEERQSVSFAGSKHNGVTIDVSGMGALNLRELAASMAGETDVMNAMPKARAAERAATAIFERNKKAIVDAAEAALRKRGIEAEVRVSGDDIIVRPTNRAMDDEAMNALQDAVASSPSSSNVRISAVTSGVADADNVAVRGEGWEKLVRTETAATVTEQSNYTLMVVNDASGKPRLRVAARSGSVPQAIEDAYQNAFRAILQAK